MSDVYPQKLARYMADQAAEGSEMFITSTEFSEVIYVVPADLKRWLVIIEWVDGMEEFDMVNVCGKAFDRMEAVIAEIRRDME